MGNNLGRKEEPYEELIEEMGIVAVTVGSITYNVLELIHKEKAEN